MYNQPNFWLFRAMQDYHTEEQTEEVIIKRQHAARTQKPKIQERFLGNVWDKLVARESKSKEDHQPETATHLQQSC